MESVNKNLKLQTRDKLNLVLVFTGGFGFPGGDAYTNRILAFAKGFAQLKCTVTLLIIYPGRNNTAESKGNIDGFNYIFCTGLKRPSGKFAKKITGVSGIINMIKVLRVIHKRQSIDAVITFSQNYLQNFPIFLFTRITNTLFIRENNEFPKCIIRRGHRKLFVFERLFFKFVNRFYDGYIFISKTLADYNRSLLPKNIPILIVPIIVDNERFTIQVDRENQITFCGNLCSEKDGLSYLLDAFSAIHSSHPDYRLILIGDTSEQVNLQRIKDQVVKLGITQKVIFTGFIPRENIPTLLLKSSLLVLSRPETIQTMGGFPTKLGEYLATGRPVLITSVSDIPQYIIHGRNGFLATPGSVTDFASKMDNILTSYEQSIQIGIAGKELTKTIFNFRFQSERVISFIRQVRESK